MVDPEVIDWLLDSDPSIRWQVLLDLIVAPVDEVAAERARVASEGWGAELLSRQTPGGIWGSADPNTDWGGSAARATLLTLGALRDMGLDPRSEEAASAVERLNNSTDWFTAMPPKFAWEGRPFFAGETEACINGRVVATGAYFGQDVQVVVDRLLGEQMADGGWNCELENGSTRGSFNSTINVLEGLLEHERATTGSPAVAEARRRGEEYLLERQLFRRLSTGEVIDPDFLRPSYPLGYRYDIIRGFDYFRAVDGPVDGRTDEALSLLAAARQGDGKWLRGAEYPDEQVIDMGERVGEPNRWVTLRAMRVLRWASPS